MPESHNLVGRRLTETVYSEVADESVLYADDFDADEDDEVMMSYADDFDGQKLYGISVFTLQL